MHSFIRRHRNNIVKFKVFMKNIFKNSKSFLKILYICAINLNHTNIVPQELIPKNIEFQLKVIKSWTLFLTKNT